MNINEWHVDYAALLPTQIANHLEQNISFLSDELPHQWVDLYKRLSPQPANVHRIKIGSYEYLYDFSTELVKSERMKIEEMVEDRLVAVHGRTQLSRRKREDSILRGFPRGPIEYIESFLRASYDRGHFIAHTLGGGLNINIFPQKTDINRGWSGDGKLYRSMEIYCQKNPSTYCFSRPFYAGQSGHPFAIEFGVLRADGTLWVNVFPNCQGTEELTEIERLFREEITKQALSHKSEESA
jgi:hypothetical protein